MRKWILYATLIALSVFCLFSEKITSSFASTGKTTPEFNNSDIAWMLTSSALVLIMTPGLGFFYGGMVRKKNVISTILQSFISMSIITVIWIIVGFSLSFGKSYHYRKPLELFIFQ